MITTNINLQCRKYINDRIKYYEEIKYLFSESIASFLVSEEIKSMYQGEDKTNEVLAIILFSIMVSDAYKILNDKLKNNTISDQEMLLYDLIKDVNSIEKLFLYLKTEREQMAYLVSSTYKFYNMNILGKINMIKNLSQQDNEYLNRIVITHQNDLEKYNKIINKEEMIKIYNNLKHHYQKDLDTKVINDNDIITMIISYIEKLKLQDIEGYEKIVSELYEYCNTNDIEYTENDLENLVKNYIIASITKDEKQEYTKK